MCVSVQGADTTADSSAALPELEKLSVVGRSSSSYAVSTRTLSVKDFEGRHSDAGSVLNTLCGVTIRRTGGLGAYTDMSIRGSGTNQVQVYLDGLPLNSASGGAVDLSKIPLGQLQEITLYTSAAPIELSGQNAGGVVELSTSPEAAPQRAVTGTIEAGSYGYIKSGALLVDGTERSRHRLSVDFAHSDNDFSYVHFEGGDSTIKYADNHAFTSINALYAHVAGFDSSRHTLKSQVSLGHTRNGLFNYETPDSNDGFSRDRTAAITEEYTGLPTSRLSLRANLSARYKENLFQRERPYYVGNARKRETLFPYAGGWTTACYALTKDLSVRALAGGSYEGYDEQDLWDPAADDARPAARRLTGRGGVEMNYGAARGLSALCRGTILYEIDSTNGVSFYRGQGVVSPAGSRGCRPSVQGEVRFNFDVPLGVSLSGSYGKRSPSLNEKFSRSDTYFGNEDLIAETRMETELGVSWKGSLLSTSIVGYCNVTHDKIKWISRSQNIFVPENIESVLGRGVEWDASLRPLSWLSAANSFTFMYNIIESDQAYWNGSFEPLLPVIKERCEVRIVLPRVTLGHSLLYSSPYFLGPQNIEYVRPGVECGFYVSITCFEKFTLTYRLDNYLRSVD
ncbi:MAG: TonB-dependent receptor, partial [Chitinispirillaceae bacterium]|nr:TonB-dependent receptor [Chitinispirillaceae bacterium]